MKRIVPFVGCFAASWSVTAYLISRLRPQAQPGGNP